VLRTYKQNIKETNKMNEIKVHLVIGL
jgi:hypothetical protein